MFLLKTNPLKKKDGALKPRHSFIPFSDTPPSQTRQDPRKPRSAIYARLPMVKKTAQSLGGLYNLNYTVWPPLQRHTNAVNDICG